MGRRTSVENVAEDFCFVCKDGGVVRACDFKNCTKAYHPECVKKESEFLNSDEHWTCDWHVCSICKKDSVLTCFCCPSSVCDECIKKSKFVQVKGSEMGFCDLCLRRTIQIETNSNNRDDFDADDTYQLLFEDYWEIVKDKEGLSLIDLQAADAVRRTVPDVVMQDMEISNSTELHNEVKVVEDVHIEEDNNIEGDTDNEVTLFPKLKTNQQKPHTQLKKSNSKKKKTFVGWGSIELIGFLSSIGIDATKQFTQVEVFDIIKLYIQTNRCFHPAKKKVVLCDQRLQSLFRKKKLKYQKINSLLEKHFADSANSDQEILFSSDEDDDLPKKNKIFGYSEAQLPENVLERKKACYASIVEANIKLVYLKRSLILSLMKAPETFKSKVIGCFVRVKNSDFYSLPCRNYYLAQVTGTKNLTTEYKVGNLQTNIVLNVSNTWKDIQISMLSDDEFNQEECEDLLALVKNGTIKKPTVYEIEEKIRCVHEDIIHHWLDQELLRLEVLIDQANEKGWRRELFAYIDRRAQLRTPSERQRLLNEVPEVIVDEDEVAAAPETALLECENRKKVPEEPRDDDTKRASIAADPSVTIPTAGKPQKKEVVIANDVPAVDNDSARNANDLPAVNNDSARNANDLPAVNNDSARNNSLPADLNPHSLSIWHYVDPLGIEQGPFSLAMLETWRDSGYFDNSFRIWRTGQSRDHAISLLDALSLWS